MLRQLAFKMFYDFVVHHSHQNGIVQVTLTAVWGYISSLLRWVLSLCVLHIFNSCVLYTLQALLSGTLFLESVAAYRYDFSEDRGSHASAESPLVCGICCFLL